MKKVYVAVCILVIIPLLSAVYISFVNIKCRELVNMAQKVYENVNRNQEKEDFQKFENKWNKLEKMLAISANHDEIDFVKESLEKSKAYLYLGNTEDYKCELKLTMKMISHIGELERPTLQNIF